MPHQPHVPLAVARPMQHTCPHCSAPLPDGPPHHAIAVDLDKLYDGLRDRVFAAEREIAGDLVRTPYVRLMALPGIAVVSAGEFGGEMGPIANYANANAITGRSGLFPSRYQSDETDHADGPLDACGPAHPSRAGPLDACGPAHSSRAVPLDACGPAHPSRAGPLVRQSNRTLRVGGANRVQSTETEQRETNFPGTGPGPTSSRVED
jgi:hypothetical protein